MARSDLSLPAAPSPLPFAAPGQRRRSFPFSANRPSLPALALLGAGLACLHPLLWAAPAVPLWT
ncbi:MAG: hypothetical protein K2W96_00925, partial [Gemmataceae bacterium]|nr:hypothetical protein [Gemmataceae bacterium]